MPQSFVTHRNRVDMGRQGIESGLLCLSAIKTLLMFPRFLSPSPTRPFEQATVQPFSAPAPAPPTLPARPPQPSVVGSPQASTGVYSPFAPLQPLPHQSRPELEWEYGNGYDSDSRQTPQHRPPTSQPPQPNPRPTSGSSNANPNTNNSGTTSWEPTQRPVGGQPLLNANRILIFPDTNHIECTKCHDTGYKAYDPNTPCSRCWSKYGQPFSSARRIALRSTIPGGNSYPPNTQKPLPKQQRPSTQPQTQSTYIQPQQTGWQQHQPHYQPHPSLMPPPQHPPPQHQPFFYGHPNVPPQGSLPPIVVRPGDPRIGGRLCPNCGE